MTNLQEMTSIDSDEQTSIDGGVAPLIWIGAGILLCALADPSISVNLWGASFSVSC